MFRTLAFCLLVLINTPVLLKTGLLVWFACNQPEIIATQCINRSRPQIKCRGKCYLAKQLKKIDQPIENHEIPLPVKLWEKAEMAPFLPSYPLRFVAAVANNRQYSKGVFAANSMADQMVIRQIFKPPA